MTRKTKDNPWKGKSVLVLGLGQYPQGSGAAATRFFARHGAAVTVTDVKSREALAAAVARLKGVRGVRFALGGHRVADVDRADLVVKNPGVRADSPFLAAARDRGIPIVSDVAMFFRLSPAPIVGVTGTRGKSTTSALVAAMLRASGKRVWLGGNIKVSPLEFLDRVRPTDAVVLELSSWQLESLAAEKRSPRVAVFTNLMRDHLNTYRDMAAYGEAKAAIFRFQRPDDAAVFSRDNPWTRRYGAQTPGRRVWTSLKATAEEDAVFVRGGRIVVRERGKETAAVPVTALRIPGEHNLANALLATAAARAAGASFAGIRQALHSFRGLPDRLETVATVRGATFVNDTTATTPDATIAALRTLASRRKAVLVCGGTDKRLDFRELAAEIPRRAKALVLLPGTATAKLRAALRRRRAAVPVVAAATMRQAVLLAFALADRGDTVLLSPGAASFGLFRNEFDRGESFVREVRRLPRAAHRVQSR